MANGSMNYVWVLNFKATRKEIDMLSFAQSTTVIQLKYSVLKNQRQEEKTNRFSVVAVKPS